MSDNHHTDLSDEDIETIIVDQSRDDLVISTIEKQLDRSIVIKDNINNVKHIVDNSIDDNGINPSAAEILQVTIESLVKPLKNDIDFQRVEIKDKTTISVEDFEYCRQRQLSAQISLENIDNRWRSFWLWVAEKTRKLVKVLKEYYQRNTLLIGHLINRIERLERFIKGIGSSSTKRQFNHTGISLRLSIKGRVPPDLLSHVDDFQKVTQTVLSSESTKNIKSLVETLKRYANTPSTNIRNEITNVLMADSYLSKVKDLDNSILSRYESSALFGNRIITSKTLRDSNWTDEQLARELDNIHTRLVYIESVVSPSETVPVLSILDLKKIVFKSKEIATCIYDYKKNLNELFSALDSLVMFTSTLANRKVLPGTENKNRDKIIQDLAIKIPVIARQPITQYINYASDTVKTLVFYVEKCLSIDKSRNK